ncbi:RNA exonuclease 4 [Wickerhamomyces ciferrii]|uniref:RNA exonuclease 4 n=1 Tax=Wickerhamomyces ciferrii (strain ATCC 14091 / BCRC 22168 / CBS 111 / JCM 3599 / NBRC 0793 / NRRL Y-1031 F-60-10) TaxID=1206466 RepID=K0KCI9_WICCF|nr:RNA exonuclease 4 [Wickerhamomyces ciferrii]CCH42770.1 RNA exonuclease 4 [Wickerhamomyces ciferrii]
MAFDKSALSSNWMKLKKKTKKPSVASKLTKKTKKKDSTKSIIDQITNDIEKKENKNKNLPPTDPKELTKWADDNDIPLDDLSKVYDISSEYKQASLTPGNLSDQKKLPGKYLAIDCEFVGVGPEGAESVLARVSIVNFHGHTVYDKFVKPREKVTDWRTWVSGVTPAHMKNAIDFKTAQKEVDELFKDKILVGHAIQHDLDALLLSHPKHMIRDTSKHPPFRQLSKGKTPALKKLTKELLKIDIQGAEHSSVEDARATMLLYKLHKKEFEKLHQRFRPRE